ncbi:sex peptide receptor-like [Pecten maximus]|uniref:sex peptide receptor-like n=1 Tax=Pecten maximus TaxID=6579 RepID=UPI0014582320|nr:sex peptide receptor-like [Pecten maximus]
MNSSIENSTPTVEYYYYYDDNSPEVVSVAAPFIVPMMGYVYPIVAILTILMNGLVVTVFTRKMRTPTSIILVALAISDTLTCLCMLPDSVYLYTLKNYKTYLPYRWCVYRHYIVGDLYRVTRTWSNWITVVLGLQRYIVVRLPFKAKQISSSRNSIIACVVACVIAVTVHLNLFLFIEVHQLPVTSETNETLPDGCYLTVPEFYIEAVGDIGKAVWMYYLISGTFSRFLPCLLLLVSTCLLVYELRKGQRFVVTACQNASSKRNTKQITQFVVAILVIFLISELHDAVAFGIYVYEIASDRLASILTQKVDAIWDYTGVMLSLVGFQCNFWIYLLMSSQFRSALKSLCLSPYRQETETTTTSQSYLQENRSLIKVTKINSDK